MITDYTVAPILEYTGQAEITFEAGSTGNNLTASATDLYPGTYIVYLNGTANITDSWTSGSAIIVSLDDLTASVYNVTLTFRDTSGNVATLTVIVTVTGSTTKGPDLLGLLIVVTLTGGPGVAGYFYWRRRRG